MEDVIGAALSQPYPLMQVVWCRYAAHLALLVLLFAWSNPQRLWRTTRRGFHLARSLLMLVMPLSFVGALQGGMPAGSVWAVFWIAPLLAMLLARAFLDERAPTGCWVACTVGALAAAAMMAVRTPPQPAQLLLALVMAISFAVYVVMTRMLHGETLLANLFYTAVGVFAVLTAFMPGQWVMPTWHDAGLLALIGVVGLLTLLTLDRAVAHAPVITVIPAIYLHLPGLALVEWVTQRESPSHRALAALLVIVGVLAYLGWCATYGARTASAARWVKQ
jgi:drug/metabolite transporter (DMT)-like permease